MRFGKWIATVLCASILGGVLGGCGSGEAESADELVKGRYVETKEELPKELEGWTVKQLFAVQGEVHLLAARQENGQAFLREWALRDGVFSDVTRDWLADLEMAVDGRLNVELLQAENDVQYIVADYAAEGEDTYKAHLWKEEGGAAREITPHEWTEPDEEWGIYRMPEGMAALNDGTLAALCYPNFELLGGEDGSIQESQELFSYYEGIMTDEENIYLYPLAYGDEPVGEIEKRAADKLDSAVTVFFSESIKYSLLSVTEEGTVIAAGEDGLFRGREAEEGIQWEKLMSGAETDFSLKDCWCTGLTAFEDGRIYALFQGEDGGNTLNRYEYDPDAVYEVKENLKLYTVYDSALLKQAAALYHRAHPEVMITIEAVYPMYYYGEADYNAVYQSLNTMLMGDGAPDILVMDHLDVDSYAEKGLLEDIGDVVAPLEEDGTLLANIAGCYVREDGSRYTIPLQFGFQMAVGRDMASEDMKSMKTLADFLEKTDYSYMGPHTVSELVDKFYPYFCGEMVREKQLDREVLGRYLDYLKVIGDNCGILAVRDDNERAYRVWELASEAKFAIEEAGGFNESMLPLSMAEYIMGDFAAFENCFIPYVQYGICSKSSYKETAKDFLKFALSDEVQGTDYYNGFPVNAAALEKLAHSDRSGAEAEASIEVDGSYVEFKISDFSAETADRLTAICRDLNRPIGEDEKIREVLTEVLEGYLNDTQSKEDTLQKVEDGLKMYLAE